MIKGKCPICSRPYAIGGLADLPTFPFCSERCRLVDLGRWVDGKYAIPGPDVADPSQQGNGPLGDEDDG